jgi:hypothetical protein
MTRARLFVIDAWTVALTGPFCPFLADCFECCLVSGVCKDTYNSPMVLILSRTPSPTDQVSSRRWLHLPTVSFFRPSFNSLGTQRMNFFPRPRPLDRILLIVSYLWPRTEASHWKVWWRPSSSAATTTATMSSVSFFFFGLECLWSAVFFVSFISIII